MYESKMQNIPVIASRNSVVFPTSSLPLTIGRSKSKAALQAANSGAKFVILVAQKEDKQSDDPKHDQLYKIGTLCKIEKIAGDSNQSFQVLLRGIGRVQILDFFDTAHYIAANAEPLPDVLDVDAETSTALLNTVKTIGGEILSLMNAGTREVSRMVDAIDDLPLLIYLCAENLNISVAQKQEILQSTSLKQRALLLLQFMEHFRDKLQVQSEIHERLSHKLGRNQREAILREQMNAIRAELGETSRGSASSGGGGDDYSQKIENANMPEDVKKIALEEARRLESAQGSPEANVIRNYLDLLCNLPWSITTSSDIVIDAARKSLDDDHYGLEKIKKRILQHLAVMKLKQTSQGTILLFLGPPGVGKTSLGASIAKALGRKFTRVSLGGVRDDAEIRGHRRTYIGAMPGRIIQGIKRAGVANPVMMLDEIDKMGRGYSGDPAGALLEVLDPEQNSNFLDHYLDVSFDLSKVMFIATANSLEGIPAPLLDRMEVIELSGYTVAEKLHIAKNHLIEKKWAESGVTRDQLAIGDDVLLRLITSYTREAGVRELQRHLAAIARAESEKVLAANGEQINVTIADVEETLGHERYLYEVAERNVPPGVVTGLAWTPRGGEILFIESSLMPGTGRLIVTGQLGEVMKESTQIALSLVRSHVGSLKPGFEFDKHDIHVHVPAGAIPKDGPSAGITMLTAIASLVSGKAISPKLAMTGEITLRGAVTPVGGIKEKILAAHRAGIERVLVARRNERDLKDVSEDVRSQIRIEFVDTALDVLQKALEIELPDGFGHSHQPAQTSSGAAHL